MNKDTKIKLRTGSLMPLLGLGTWELSNPEETVKYALETGYGMIDTSSDYGTQPGIGEALKQSGIARDEVYIVTKAEETDDAYERTKSNLEELKLMYIDLMLIHRPPPEGAGEDLWEGLIKAREEGLTRDIGVSNYSSGLIDSLIGSTGEIPVVNQIEWSPFGYSEEMLKYCQEKKIIIQAYSSLTRGTRQNDEALDEIAQKYNKSPAQILIRWNLQLGTVPIAKASQKKHLEENIGVFDFEISGEEMEILSGLNEGYSSLGKPPYI